MGRFGKEAPPAGVEESHIIRCRHLHCRWWAFKNNPVATSRRATHEGKLTLRAHKAHAKTCAQCQVLIAAQQSRAEWLSRKRSPRKRLADGNPEPASAQILAKRPRGRPKTSARQVPVCTSSDEPVISQSAGFAKEANRPVQQPVHHLKHALDLFKIREDQLFEAKAQLAAALAAVSAPFCRASCPYTTATGGQSRAEPH